MRIQGLPRGSLFGWFGFIILSLSAVAQTSAPNEWTWMGGISFSDAYAQYGSLGTPALGNIPAARYQGSTWADKNGNFWLFGGVGAGYYGLDFNDLWKYNPSTNEWAWMGGCAPDQVVVEACILQSQPNGIYGTLGTAAPGNSHPSRSGAASWTDSNGNFWLFGGSGLDST